MQRAIGIFDSGVGGTSIWKEIRKMLPNETTIYLADSKNAPYGEKSKEEIIQLSKKNTELLIQKNCKIIVVACNTATTNAIGYLRENYSVPFIGIEPAIKPAALHTKTKKVGVLATKGTLSSHLFHNTSKLFAEGITILEQEGKGLVELVEAGKVYTPETKMLLRKFLDPMLEQNIDCLVLGCTHYPYLIPVLKEILPSHITIIDSGEAVARQTKAVLENKELLSELNQKTDVFYSNAEIEVLKSLLEGSNVNVSYLDF
ncbi:glutamate racemase [Flagellimonas nanhaiensis]|uniref:Glutamate racemase n=1 Tax=Flagellimonas nanhaiensis TaxID=2292706 RepID=A0A371JNJ0_9FLAO|nr:glutamate racemase [Allomuricauda nanhaiensis]RDY58809.1 glutamate racemase [Allomuricauda nanhaiensis]